MNAMTNEMDNFPYWSEEYTMNFLGYSQTSMRALRKSKAVTRYEIGHRYFYDKQEIIKLIESSKVVKQEQDKLDKYIQSMNNTISLKDVSISEKNFILDKTYFILNRILNSLQEMDSDKRILRNRDWYLLMMCIESKGDFNVIAEKYDLTRERIRQIFEKSIRVLTIRTSVMQKSYLESCLEIEKMKSEVHTLQIENKELLNLIDNITLKYNNLLNEVKTLHPNNKDISSAHKKINSKTAIYDSLNNIEILSTKIYDLDISTRLFNGLKAYGVETLNDLLKLYKQKEIIKLRNVGGKSVEEVGLLLHSYGLINLPN